jgi:AraC-like DNA-binding protein
LWCWEGYAPPHRRERILPFGMMELNIDLSGAPMVITDAEGGQPQSLAGAFVAGARSRHFWVDTAHTTSPMSVWFKPGGARAFFGVPASALHNQHVPLELLWGRAEAERLADSLCEARTPAERFACVEAALLSRLSRAEPAHRAVGYALNMLTTAPSAPAIAQIERCIALSPTRFIDVFREEVGLTPKLYSRVQRFQHAARLMAAGACHGLAEVALAAGYSDQAHFTREFRAFSGLTPTSYQPQSRDHHSNLADDDGG